MKEMVNEMNESYRNFGEFLQKKREERKITLRRMAEKMEKLCQISRILNLSDEEETLMFDLAGKKRNSVAPDLPEYIMNRNYVSAALRTARDLDADEADWMRFVEELRQRKG